MLYATDGIESDKDFEKAMVGVASVWYVHHLNSTLVQTQQRLRYEGNPFVLSPLRNRPFPNVVPNLKDATNISLLSVKKSNPH